MQVEKFYYDNKIVKAFGYATVIFSIVGMLAGLYASIQIYLPQASMNMAATTFGRVRPLYSNAGILAFVGNALFAAIFYSLQRISKARLFNARPSRILFQGWLSIIVGDAISLSMCKTRGPRYK